MTETSKYQQIIDFLKRQIEREILTSGQRIPSIRQLSQDFSCSKDTVQKALLELKYQQYIYAKPQSGYYVLAQKKNEKPLPLKIKDNRQESFDDFRLCVNEALIGRENFLFNYYPQKAGLTALQESVHQLLNSHYIYNKADQIAFTSGTKQAL